MLCLATNGRGLEDVILGNRVGLTGWVSIWVLSCTPGVILGKLPQFLSASVSVASSLI